MAKALHYLKWAANVLLGFGCFGALSENPDNLTPNFVGFICIALLIAINKDRDND